MTRRNASRIGLVLIALILVSGILSLGNPMSWVPFVIIIGAVLFGPGILIALVVLLPPIKKLIRRSDQTKAATPIVMGAVAFVVTFAILMIVWVEVAIALYSINQRYENIPQAKQITPLVFDLWRREMLPPFLRQTQPACYEDDPAICKYVIALTGDSMPFPAESWGSYLVTGVASLPSMSLCVGLVDYFTRRKSKPELATLATI